MAFVMAFPFMMIFDTVSDTILFATWSDAVGAGNKSTETIERTRH